MYKPFIDHFINQLEERFLKQKNIFSKIDIFLPHSIVNLNKCQINNGIDIFCNQWPDILPPSDNILKKETLSSKQKWTFSDFVDALNLCNELFFPNICTILKRCATIPVTACTPERSFSSFKRLKSYLTNIICENRLNGLALMNIHRETDIDIEKIIRKLAEKNRRISL